MSDKDVKERGPVASLRITWHGWWYKRSVKGWELVS